MNRTRLLFFLGAITLGLSLPGCGSKGVTNPPPPPPPPTPTPAPVTTVVSQGSGSLGSSTVAPVNFTTTSAGAVDVTVDWTFASNDVDIFLARGTSPCTLATFNDRSCGFIATEESTTMKPEKLHVANLAAGPYTLYVANYGSSDESVSWQVVLTTVSAASASSATHSEIGHAAAKGTMSRILGAR